MNLFLRSLLVMLFTLATTSTSAQGWLWGRSNTGSGMDAWPVGTDAKGNVFVAGINVGGEPIQIGNIIIPVPPGSIISQTILAKYDPNGNVLWAKGVQGGAAYPVNITVDTGGNLILLGLTDDIFINIDGINITNEYYNPSRNHFQYFLAKFDPDGHVLWAKSSAEGAQYIYNFARAQMLTYGGVTTDSTGNIFVTGNFNVPTTHVGPYSLSNADTSTILTLAAEDIFVAKYSPSGAEQWATRIGGVKDDRALGIAMDNGGNVYIAGHTLSDSLTMGASSIPNPYHQTLTLIAELNPSGVPIWGMSPTVPDNNSTATGIANDNFGNLYLTGAYMGQDIVFDTTTIHAFYHPYTFVTTNLFLMQLTPDHRVSWGKAISSPQTDIAGYSVASSPCGTVWVSGAWCTEQYPGFLNDSIMVEGQVMRTPDSSYDPVFVLGYDINGNLVGKTALQSGGDDQTGLACDPQGNVLLCSDFINTPAYAGFVIGTDTIATSYVGAERLFIAKYNNQAPDTLYHSTDTLICKNTAIVLTPPGGYTSYTWNLNHQSGTVSLNDSGTWWVYCQNNCSSTVLVDTMKVDTKNCDCFCVFPTAFTPNYDGKNDGFRPIVPLDCIASGYTMSIYNRWGNVVFTTHDPGDRWFGDYMGRKQDAGVFFYQLSFINSHTNQKSIYKGDITLVL